MVSATTLRPDWSGCDTQRGGGYIPGMSGPQLRVKLSLYALWAPTAATAKGHPLLVSLHNVTQRIGYRMAS